MKEMKRIISLLLCLVMLAGYLPVGALATEDGTEPSSAEETTIELTEAKGDSVPATPLIPIGDTDEESTETTAPETTVPETTVPETTVPETTVPEITVPETTVPETTVPETTVPETTVPEETVLETTEPTEEEVVQEDDGILQILVGSDYTEGMGSVLSRIQTANADIDTLMFLGGYTDVNALVSEAGEYYAFDNETILVQGTQDEMNEDLFGWSGNHDTDSYGAFVINEEEYEIGIQDILSVLESYLTEKAAAGYDKPIFVLSYRPLHYGSGNADARALFDILNKAGAEGLTIVYVYGQNTDTYVGDGAVYLPVGDQIFVAESETYAEETLTFTYMNAGASSDNMSVFTFVEGETEDTVSVTRYDAEGVCLLKNEGIEDELMVADTTTYESPAEIKITAPADPVVESESDTLELTNEPAAQAEGDTIYILAGGDFQEAGDHANSAANVTNILAQVSQKYATMNGFLFIGDYDCETHNDATETANGITALMGAVQGSYSNLNDENSVLVQGNHDYMDSRIDATGGHDFDGYAAYVLNEDDYANGGGSQSGVQTLANNLKTWLDNKIGEGYDAPIFVVSHLPLAFTPRTVTQGDAKYAKYIFDVLNDAGEKGLNIIFLHGHDHAYGPDNYMGGEAIYLAEGDKINIAEAGSQSKWTEETLNFTYMNAGYTGYYSDAFTYNTTAGTDKLTMTVFAITDNEVTVERYSEDGLYNMKSVGRNGSYSDTSVTADSLGLAYNTTVYTSPQTIALADTSTEDSSGSSGTIGDNVAVTPEFDNDVTTSGDSWTTITEPVGGTTTYTYTQATSITAGEEYVIVGNNNTVALMDDDGDMESQDVNISGSTMTSNTELTEWTFSGSSSGTIYNGTRYLRYNNNFSLNQNQSSTLTFTDNGSNFRIYNNANYGTDYSFYYNGSSWTRSSSTQYVRLYQLTRTTTTGGTNGLYGKLDGKLSYTVASGTSAEDALAAVKAGIAIKYATAADYSDEAEYADDGEGMTWTLDPNYDGDVPGDYAVTISYNGIELGTAEVIVPGIPTYYTAEGEGLYTVEMNTSADDALAAVKAGITVYSSVDANGTNKTTIDDEDVTWQWVDTYDGKNNGPYTVEILKDGTSLGTVEVKVNVHYDTEIADGWVSAGTSPTQYRYVLDTNGYETGSNNRYLFVASDAAYAMDEDGSGVVPVTFNDDETEATVDSRDYEWYIYQGNIGGSTRRVITKTGSSSFLYHADYTLHLGTDNNGYWTIDENRQSEGLYRFYNADGGSTWYLRYHTDGYMGVTTSTERYLRLYKYDGEIEGGDVYAKIEGNTIYYVTQGKSATSALNTVKAGITGYISNSADGSNATELEDSELTWTWLNKYNGQVEGSYWVQISYNGEVLGTVQVNVVPGVVNNYPEYPNEGAVKVSKTATGVDFQSSGIAQVEVSASGVPIKKGVDVIVMLDTSSSMTSHTVAGTSKTRAEVLEESLEDLIAQFKTPGDDGELLDIRVAIADFNGFYGENQSASGTPYDRDAADTMSDDIYYNAASEAQVYTGDGTLGAGAFVDAADLANSYTLNYTSGTNYDYAMDAIYQMGTAVKEANGNEDRDLFVIFMSDGAAMQWNYYHSQGASSRWNSWITGAWDADDLTTNNLNCTTHAYYYDEVDHDGDGMANEHRMANAIKGDPSEEFEVIRKTNTLGSATGETNMYMVPGLGATMFSISFDAQADDQVTEASMDKSIETLASEQTGTTQYYYKVTSADELSSAFDSIGSEIAYAASNARFVDQMGDSFNLQMETVTYTVVEEGAEVEKTAEPKIEIISYDIYTRQDYLNGTITEDKIGDRKGTYTVLETVTFNEDGTEAYSDQIDSGTTNILADGTQEGYVKGVIYAKTFLYNTNVTDVTITGVNIPTGTTSAGLTTGTTAVLPSETFYWKMGTIQTSELAMRYYVYLEGSMEGTKEAGSYATNEFATLYYDNYLGNSCYKETVSPVMAWKSANVSYAFYLVNENGEIIVNQTTGQTGSFANKIAVTNPVVYEEILLNNTDQISSLEVEAVSDDVLPKYYELYDTGAVYEVTINSNSTGSWEITMGDVDVASTYVTQYKNGDASAYSNELHNYTIGDDYTHTVVWFAVVWKLQAHPDTVVVDYGLPVDISVLTNDMFGEYGKLAGIGAYAEGIEETTAGASMETGFGTNYTGEYGTATADTTTGKVRYTLNSMQMDSYEKFAYAVNYTGAEKAGYYYDTVTVIPATTIYYEDSFLAYTGSNTEWVEAVEKYDGSGYVQSEDRPGKYSLTDANNIYGYDGVNLSMSTYSLGNAKKVHVDADSYATASFTFAGTGFDVISMTSNDTGLLMVQVYEKDTTTLAKSFSVDTYYGYTAKYYSVTYTYSAETGTWTETVGEELPEKPTEAATALPTENLEDGQVVTTWKYEYELTPDNGKAIYQVPVIQVENLTYGKYDVVLTAAYADVFDHKTSTEGFDLYVDAVRIYDPANDGAADDTDDTTIEDAYKADGEGWPSYIELRNQLIDTETLGNATTDTVINGLVFIDGDAEIGDAQIADYISYGPNNEVYLAPGQRVAFLLSTPANIANVHIGIKSADGGTGTYTITNIAQSTNAETGVEAGAYYGAKTSTVNTTTDMYYDLTGWKNDIIVISNTGSMYGTTGIISLTNIKSTYTSDPNGTVTTSDEYGIMTTSLEEEIGGETELYMTPVAATLTLRSLNSVAEDEVEDTEPEETQPEATVPEESIPETTIPEETEPEETEPETTVPEETKPADQEEQIQEAIQNVVKKVVNTVRNVLKNLFGGWFR